MLLSLLLLLLLLLLLILLLLVLKTFQRFLISIINDYYRVLNRLGTRIRLSYQPDK